MKRTVLLILAGLAVAGASDGRTWDEEWSRVFADDEYHIETVKFYLPDVDWSIIEVADQDYYYITYFYAETVPSYSLVMLEPHPDGTFSKLSRTFYVNPKYYQYHEYVHPQFYKTDEEALRAAREAAAEWYAEVPALKHTLDTPTLYATGLEAIDGDTFRAETAAGTVEKVRLIGVDAPELGGPEPELADRAKDYLAGLVEGESVRLVLGVEGRDRYDRLLAYVFVDEDKDERLRAIDYADNFRYDEEHFIFTGFINEEMLKKGLARVYTVEPDVGFVRDYERAEHNAREGELGVWE